MTWEYALENSEFFMVLFKLTFQVQSGTCRMGLTSAVVVGSMLQGFV